MGDHDTLHHLFNHPDVQGRLDPKVAPVLKKERELREDQVLPDGIQHISVLHDYISVISIDIFERC